MYDQRNATRRLSQLVLIGAMLVASQESHAQATPRRTAPSRAPSVSSAAPRTAAQRQATLLDENLPFWKTRAPATFIADVETSKGKIAIEFTREWAPVGVDHFYNLARAGYFDDSRFYRVVPNFVAQFGLAGDPRIANLWGSITLKADPVRESNLRGTLSYAQFKPTDRSTNIFINLHDSPNLDTLGFTPIGRVVEGMEVADSLYGGYNDLPISDPPLGDAKRMYREGNKYLDDKYPKLDRIIRVTIRTQQP
ncbi:MAG TPA: peptidylprolyl isomerase [Gemmatimonadaceae bacterium]|jgi:cyclophilin family peptidyl-prolyl cis-trans isomerase